MGFHLATLGPVRLDGPHGELLQGRRKELALLAYLARRGARRVPRAALAALLWGNRPEAAARDLLRHALLRLRRAVGPAIDVTAVDVGLRPGSVTLDVILFESDLAAGNLASAVDRYAGDFLHGLDDAGEGEFRAWVDAERVGLRRAFGWSVERLIEAAESAGDGPGALTWAERWAAAMPLEEEASRRVVLALHREGRTAEAVARHAMFAVETRDAFGRDPSDEFLRLAEGLAAEERLTRMSSAAALFTPDLTGREGPWQALEEAFAEARVAGAVVVVEGEEGIGKTRLCAEFIRSLRTTDPRIVVLETSASATPQSETAQRLLARLRQAPGLSGAPDAVLAELTEMIPALRSRFPALPGATGRMTPAEALIRVLADVAAETPVVVFLDDFPEADEPTQRLLLDLAAAQTPGVLVLLAGPSAALADCLLARGLLSTGRTRRLKLAPLTAADFEAMIAAIVALSGEDRLRLASFLHRETGGNPQLAWEMITALADRDVLRLADGSHWSLGPDLESASLPLPVTLRQAMRDRLAALGPAARTVLIAAAAAGPEIDTDRLGSGVPRDVLADGLDELVARRLLEPVREGAAFAFPSRVAWRAAAELTAPERTLGGIGWLGGPRARRRGLIAAGGGVLAVLTLVSVSARRNTTDAAVGSTHARRVIVSSFTNETGDATLDPLSRYASEWLAEELARSGLATVVWPPPALDPARTDRAEALSAQSTEVARRRADLVIGGAYRRAGDSLRVTAWLADARSGVLQWSIEAGGVAAHDPTQAVEALRDRVIPALAHSLDERLPGTFTGAAAVPSYAAYLAFSAGLDHLYARRGSEAVARFLEAYALDTTYALPLLYASFQSGDIGRQDAADSLARLLAPRRDQLPPFERHVLDMQVAWADGNLPDQLAAARAAAALAPGSLIDVYYLPRAAIALNRPAEAVSILTTIDPDSGQVRMLPGYWAMLSSAAHMAGDYDLQLRSGVEARRRFPNDPRALFYEARAFAALGRLRELDAVLDESLLLPAAQGWEASGLALHITAADELLAHGDSLASAAVLERALSFYSQAPPALNAVPRQQLALARVLYRLGRIREARPMLEALLNEPAVTGEFRLDVMAHIGFVAAAGSDAGTVTRIDAWLQAPDVHTTPGQATEFRAALAAARGHRDEAIRLLRQAVSEGRPYDIVKHTMFEYAGLRGHRLFEEWLRPKG